MRTFTQAAVLRHSFINWRHLACGIDEAVQVEAIKLCLVQGEQLAARAEKSCFGLRIGLKCRLVNLTGFEKSGFLTTDNDGGQSFASCLLVFRGGMVLDRSEAREKLIGALADVRESADMRRLDGEAVG